jgi:hypothetical protein
VPELTVVNTGTKPVLLAVGDVIQGGRQDRVIVSDALIPPTKKPITVAVNCVESGRWSPGAQNIAFSYGGRGESALKRVLEVERNQQSTWNTVKQLNAGKTNRIARVANVDNNLILDQLRSPEHQMTDNDTQNIPGNNLTQGRTASVGEAFPNHGLNPSTGTYMASLTSEEVVISLQPYLDALNPLLDESNLIGLVAALNGKVINAELYGDTRLFNASAKDMIRALSLDALSRSENEEVSATVAPSDAAYFLSQAMSGASTVESNHLGQRTRRTSPEAEAFEFMDSSTGTVLHLSAYAR